MRPFLLRAFSQEDVYICALAVSGGGCLKGNGKKCRELSCNGGLGLHDRLRFCAINVCEHQEQSP
ncbi:MAG: hypothetical protein EBT20_08070 [Alphaproteobacteria bacterium]|nr:hypothetical protein [Alphaproteobacteria bacterium]